MTNEPVAHTNVADSLSNFAVVTWSLFKSLASPRCVLCSWCRREFVTRLPSRQPWNRLSLNTQQISITGPPQSLPPSLPPLPLPLSKGILITSSTWFFEATQVSPLNRLACWSVQLFLQHTSMTQKDTHTYRPILHATSVAIGCIYAMQVKSWRTRINKHYKQC